MTSNPPTEKRWSWWGQVRDVVVATIGIAIVATSLARDTYDPIAMLFAAVCLGIVSSGVLSRYLIGRWEDGGRK